MVQKNILNCFDVLRKEEIIEDSFRKGSEDFVGRGKDSEGAISRVCIHQTCHCESSDQSPKVIIPCGDINNGSLSVYCNYFFTCANACVKWDITYIAHTKWIKWNKCCVHAITYKMWLSYFLIILLFKGSRTANLAKYFFMTKLWLALFNLFFTFLSGTQLNSETWFFQVNS